ncbi:U3 small nucleolar RNA-associated protein 22 [Schistosoma japonicum]|nr:U3 small nucleolar RNA-associated protein 22 [Schistosoma japonicum]
MVRGGARIKAGGINMIQDDSQIIKPLSLNISLFQFLRNGYFEKDLLTYCANRLNEYSCIYWFDPIMNGINKQMKLNTVLTTTTTTTSKIINHNNVHNHAMDEIISQTDHSLLNKINQIIEFLKPYEIYLEYYEIILRFLNFIEIPIRSILLLSSIEEYKLNCYTQLSIIKKLLKQLSLHLYYKLIQYKNKFSIINHNKFNRQLQRFNDINKHSLLLNDNNINKEIIEMSNYVNKAQYHSNDVIDNKKEASSTSSIMNKQTSLINEYKLNYTTTYKQNSSKCDMIRNNQPLNIDPFTLNIPIVNIKSKLDWYNFTKHQFNSKYDNSSLEQSTGIHRIFYL